MKQQSNFRVWRKYVLLPLIAVATTATAQPMFGPAAEATETELAEVLAQQDKPQAKGQQKDKQDKEKKDKDKTHEKKDKESKKQGKDTQKEDKKDSKEQKGHKGHGTDNRGQQKKAERNK